MQVTIVIYDLVTSEFEILLANMEYPYISDDTKKSTISWSF